MNAVARVAVRFIKNRCRFRRSLPCIALVVAVPIVFYVLCVPNPQREYVKFDHDSLVLLGSVKLSPSVAREALPNRESLEWVLDSQIRDTVSTNTNCQGNGTKCRSTKVNDGTTVKLNNHVTIGNKKLDGSSSVKLYRAVTNKVDVSTTIKLENHNTNPAALVTPKHSIQPQTVSNLSLSSHESYSNSFPIKGLLPRVLLIYDNFSVDSAKRAKVFLQTQRIDFDIYSTSKKRTPPPLSKLSTETDEVIGRYALILCADIGIFFNRLDEAKRRLFYEYSRAFNISIITLQRTAFDQVRGYTEPKFIYGKYLIYPIKSVFMNYVMVDDSKQWLFTKGGITVTTSPKSAHWQVFLTIESQNVNNRLHNEPQVSNERASNHQNHLSLQFLHRKTHDASLTNPRVLANLRYTVSYLNSTRVSRRTSPLVLVDRDLIPGVVTVLIGMDIRFWLTKLILMDIIRSYSSLPLLRFDNRRWVMVDIDDIFVAPQGLRMTTSDVEV